MNRNSIFTVLMASAAIFTAQAKTTAERNSAGDVVLKNDNVTMVFSGGNDFLLKEFTTGGKNVLPAAGSTAHPWQMTYRGPNGENPLLMPRWGVYKGTQAADHEGVPAVKATWDMVLDDTPKWPVTVTVALPDDAEMPQFYIDAALPEDWVITDIEFPRITVAQIPGGNAVLHFAYGTEY